MESPHLRRYNGFSSINPGSDGPRDVLTESYKLGKEKENQGMGYWPWLLAIIMKFEGLSIYDSMIWLFKEC